MEGREASKASKTRELGARRNSVEETVEVVAKVNGMLRRFHSELKHRSYPENKDDDTIDMMMCRMEKHGGLFPPTTFCVLYRRRGVEGVSRGNPLQRHQSNAIRA